MHTRRRADAASCTQLQASDTRAGRLFPEGSFWRQEAQAFLCSARKHSSGTRVSYQPGRTGRLTKGGKGATGESARRASEDGWGVGGRQEAAACRGRRRVAAGRRPTRPGARARHPGPDTFQRHVHGWALSGTLSIRPMAGLDRWSWFCTCSLPRTAADVLDAQLVANLGWKNSVRLRRETAAFSLAKLMGLLDPLALMPWPAIPASFGYETDRDESPCRKPNFLDHLCSVQKRHLSESDGKTTAGICHGWGIFEFPRSHHDGASALRLPFAQPRPSSGNVKYPRTHTSKIKIR